MECIFNPSLFRKPQNTSQFREPINLNKKLFHWRTSQIQGLQVMILEVLILSYFLSSDTLKVAIFPIVQPRLYIYIYISSNLFYYGTTCSFVASVKNIYVVLFIKGRIVLSVWPIYILFVFRLRLSIHNILIIQNSSLLFFI